VKHLPFAVKLILALALTVVVAVGTVGILTHIYAGRHFETYVSYGMTPRTMMLVPILAEYYAARGSWVGVEDVLNRIWTTARARGLVQGSVEIQLILTDAAGNVVAYTPGARPAKRLRANVLQRGQAIRLNGRLIGYLLTGIGPQEQAFNRRLNTSIVWAGVLASFVALLLGLLLTGTVTKPLRVVRDAAKRIAAGDLSYRVPVYARDEIGELAQQFNEMAAALERDEQLRRTMMADIAHELRTPLAVIRGQVEALRDGVFELTPANLDPIYDQTLLLGRLVEDLRDLALAEAGRLPLERTAVALDRLVQRVVEAFQNQAHERQVTLTAEIAQQVPPVQADAQRLEQVLTNLLSNALRYTPPGGRVTVRCAADASWVTLAVEDTGVGIAPEDLPHVFDRFYRTDKTRSRAGGGTGLGLSIAKQIVEAHGGKITAQSTVGKGSTFTVYLPHKT
jgi:signal transduction histidine kinase